MRSTGPQVCPFLTMLVRWQVQMCGHNVKACAQPCSVSAVFQIHSTVRLRLARICHEPICRFSQHSSGPGCWRRVCGTIPKAGVLPRSWNDQDDSQDPDQWRNACHGGSPTSNDAQLLVSTPAARSKRALATMTFASHSRLMLCKLGTLLCCMAIGCSACAAGFSFPSSSTTGQISGRIASTSLGPSTLLLHRRLMVISTGDVRSDRSVGP